MAITIDKNNKITIRVNVAMYGSLATMKLNGVEYYKLFKIAIEKFWSGTYRIYGYKVSLKTIVNISRGKGLFFRCLYPLMDSVAVFTNNSFGLSYVSLLKGGWKRFKLGYMTLFKGEKKSLGLYSINKFKRVCAHEMGHILGVDDLYNKSIDIIRKYSYKGNYSMMGHQWYAPRINNYDLIQVLLAFKYNELQGWS